MQSLPKSQEDTVFLLSFHQIPPDEIRTELIKLVEDATASELLLLIKFARSVLK